MAEVRVVRRLSNPAEVVWALIGDFGGLHRWHPHVSGLDLSWEGRIRTVHYVDGGHAVERLEARNDQAHRYVYALVDGTLPVQDCRATLQVAAHGRGCTVVWSSVFEPLGAGEDAAAALRGLYGAGLASLAAALEG
jgi:uncharacterized protein YndB with AHSA1/START domain